jgi:hypothetical protein
VAALCGQGRHGVGRGVGAAVRCGYREGSREHSVSHDRGRDDRWRRGLRESGSGVRASERLGFGVGSLGWATSYSCAWAEFVTPLKSWFFWVTESRNRNYLLNSVPKN